MEFNRFDKIGNQKIDIYKIGKNEKQNFCFARKITWENLCGNLLRKRKAKRRNIKLE